MRYRAFAFMEIHEPTTRDGKEFKTYSLYYNLLTAIRKGNSGMITNDLGEFIKILSKERKKGVKIITHRLPYFMKSVEDVVGHGHDFVKSGILSHVKRVPADFIPLSDPIHC